MGIFFSKGGDNTPDLRVDLENAQPSAEENETYTQVLRLLAPTTQILTELRNYGGCGEQIRQAISSPSPQTEDAAWATVVPAVETLKVFYEFSLVLEDAVPRLLQRLTSGNVHEAIERQPAITRQFADILDFVFEFDELKMANSSIQNDFSYYRRTMNRMKMSRQNTRQMTVNDELANRMSLFYAYHTPMMKTVIDVTTSYVSSRQGGEVCQALAAVSGVCYHTITKNRVQHSNAIPFLLRVMVATTLLYDHIHSAGAFVKDSPINIKNVVKAINNNGEKKAPALLNALKFSSRHVNDPTTPKATKQLLGI